MISNEGDVKKHTVYEAILVRADSTCPRAGEGSAMVLTDGSILFAFGVFDGAVDDANAVIVKLISRNEGRTVASVKIVKSGTGLHVTRFLQLFNNRGACKTFWRI